MNHIVKNMIADTEWVIKNHAEEFTGRNGFSICSVIRYVVSINPDATVADAVEAFAGKAATSTVRKQYSASRAIDAQE